MNFKALVKELLSRFDLEIRRVSEKIGSDHPASLDLLGLLVRDWAGRSSKKLKLLQIGANDGLSEDYVFPLIEDDLVVAILVEPMPGPFSALSALHDARQNVSLCNAAVSRVSGPVGIHVVRSADGSHSDDNMASLDKSFAEERLRRRVQTIGTESSLEWRIETLTVESMRVTDILAINKWNKPDIVAIDAEGLDAEIVDQLLSDEVEPAIIFFETVNMSRPTYFDLIARLVKAGYVTARSGGNAVAVLESFTKCSAPDNSYATGSLNETFSRNQARSIVE